MKRVEFQSPSSFWSIDQIAILKPVDIDLSTLHEQQNYARQVTFCCCSLINLEVFIGLELSRVFVDNKVVLRIRWSYELRFQHWVLNIFCLSTMVSRSSRQMRWVLVKLVFNSDVPSDSNARLLLLLLEVTKRFNCNFECWKWKLSHTSIIRLDTNVKKKLVLFSDVVG